MKRIGFSSHCFSRSVPIERVIDLCLEHGFNAMELNVDDTTFNPRIVKPATVDRIRSIGGSGAVRFSMHGPEDVNLAAPTPEGRAEAVRRMEEAIRLAAELRIAVVVVHPGKIEGEDTPGRRAEAVRENERALRRCARTARALGVTASVENLCHVRGTVAPDIRSFLEMCRRVGPELIGVTLDTGHSFVDGLAATVEAVAGLVDHIHIDDNSGLKSEHLELGRGILDFPAIAGFLRSFAGNINIELKRTRPENPVEEDLGPVLRSREYLRRLLDGAAG